MTEGRDRLPLAICDGGPHLFIPWDLVSQWRGADGGLLPDFADTDYGRACLVSGPAGLLQVGPGQGLVIAGSPAFTYWVGAPNRPGGDLVTPRSWTFDFTNSQIREACGDAVPKRFRDLDLVLLNPSHGCCLFAACDRAPDRVYATSWVPLARGSYRVFAAEVEWPAGLQLQLIRLEVDY